MFRVSIEDVRKQIASELGRSVTTSDALMYLSSMGAKVVDSQWAVRAERRFVHNGQHHPTPRMEDEPQPDRA